MVSGEVVLNVFTDVRFCDVLLREGGADGEENRSSECEFGIVLCCVVLCYVVFLCCVVKVHVVSAETKLCMCSAR